MTLKDLVEEAKCNFNNNNQANLTIVHAVNEVHSKVMLGEFELSLITSPLGSKQKDLVTQALIAKGFNAYFLGGTLRIFWGDATQGIAKDFLDSVYAKIDCELACLMEYTVKTASSNGSDGCYFYLDDEDFRELLSKYSKQTILKVLRKQFKVTDGSLQEIYVAWA